MRTVTEFEVTGANYEELIEAARSYWASLLGVEDAQLPWDSEMSITPDTTVSADGSGPLAVRAWSATVIIRAQESK